MSDGKIKPGLPAIVGGLIPGGGAEEPSLENVAEGILNGADALLNAAKTAFDAEPKSIDAQASIAQSALARINAKYADLSPEAVRGRVKELATVGVLLQEPTADMMEKLGFDPTTAAKFERAVHAQPERELFVGKLGIPGVDGVAATIGAMADAGISPETISDAVADQALKISGQRSKVQAETIAKLQAALQNARPQLLALVKRAVENDPDTAQDALRALEVVSDRIKDLAMAGIDVTRQLKTSGALQDVLDEAVFGLERAPDKAAVAVLSEVLKGPGGEAGRKVIDAITPSAVGLGAALKEALKPLIDLFGLDFGQADGLAGLGPAKLGLATALLTSKAQKEPLALLPERFASLGKGVSKKDWAAQMAALIANNPRANVQTFGEDAHGDPLVTVFDPPPGLNIDFASEAVKPLDPALLASLVQEKVTPIPGAGAPYIMMTANPDDDFRPIIPDALLRRLQTPIKLEPLSDQAMREIAAILVDKASERLQESDGVRAEFSAAAREALFSGGREDGPRGLSEQINETITDQASQAIVEGRLKKGDTARFDVDEHGSIRLTDLPPGDAIERRTASVQAALEKSVFGQSKAMNQIATDVATGESREPDGKPIAVTELRGSVGTGMTHSAWTLANECYGGRIFWANGTEMHQAHDMTKLLGAPQGWIGDDQPSQLFQSIGERPMVLLIDEIDKAHPDLVAMIETLKEDGFIIDNQGKRIEGKNLHIVTTQSGKNGLLPLDRGALAAIVGVELGKLADRAQSKQSITVDVSDAAQEELVRFASQRSDDYGARAVSKAIDELITGPLASLFVDGGLKSGQTAQVVLEQGQIRVLAE